MKMSTLINRIEEASDSEMDAYQRISKNILKKRIRLYVQSDQGRRSWVIDGLKKDERESLSEFYPLFKWVKGFKGDGIMVTMDKKTAMDAANKLGMEYEIGSN